MNPSSSLTHRLVEHVVQTRFESLPETAHIAAKVFILDSLGVALSGTRVPLVGELKHMAAGWGHGDDARIWGTGERVPAGTAAFINGYQIHNQEWDCVHEPAVVHPMAVVLATLLADAERTGGITGQQLISGCSIAVDVATSIGRSARNTLRFFRPAMCGALGATAALAHWRGFDASTTRSALGLAYSQLSGTMQAHVEGSPVLPMQIGFNTRAALNAVELAARGIAGPTEFLEGPFGYFTLIDPEWDRTALEHIGTEPSICELSHKPFPSGRATHGGVDGAMSLCAEHGITIESIRQIRVIAPPLVIQLVDRPAKADMAASYARLCLPYVAATALLKGSVDVTDFSMESFADPRRLELASRIVVLRDGNPSLNALSPQRVEISVESGREYAMDLPDVLGAPGRPLSRTQHLAKFRRAATTGLRPLPESGMLQLIELVDRLETVQDVSQLVDALMFSQDNAA
ncbi:MAG: MmgE/PrpD family protein [Steroidobacteraceae bacterium]